jgi:anti-sigma factor RsiW
MRTPQRPFGEDPSRDEGPSYEWLDEWLCEYVDGTMDPSVETVFEQYVEANPELKAHVERLRKTREILCGCDASEADSPDLKPGTDEEWDDESVRVPPALAGPSGERFGHKRSIAASIAVALIVGFLAGSVLVDPSALSPLPTAEAVDTNGSAQDAVRETAPPRSGRSVLTVRSEVPSASGEDVFVDAPPMSSTTISDSVWASSTVTSAGGR